MTAAKFHVDEEAGAGGHLLGGGRLRPERHHLAVLGPVGDGAGLGHVYRVARHRQPGRDDVVERDRLGDLTVEGDPNPLPAGVDLCAYRIVQEALTNTLKHARPANARVTIRYRANDVELEVLDDGQGIGNLPSADRYGFESTSTLLFDPIGWKGAKLDFTIGAERTRVRDPLTGEKREIAGHRALLGRSGPATQPEHGRDESVVRLGALGEGEVLGMVDDRQPQRPGIRQR